MKISKLFRGMDCRFFGDKKTNVTGLNHNSKTVREGDIYFALRDTVYIAEAVSNGAAAVVAATRVDAGVPCIVVSNPRLAMALAAGRFYNAAKKLRLFGVVGTNGKTTTAYILKHILEHSTGKRVGLIGTTTTVLTTPDPIDLHRHFAEMFRDGIRTVVMEISAHAIHYQKIAGLRFAGVVFTNITQDHLDFFPSFTEYKNTKVSFFAAADIRNIAINADDESGAEVMSAAIGRAKIMTYSCADKNVVLSADGSRFDLFGARVHVPLVGRFNAANTLGAVTVAEMCGIGRGKIMEALPTVPPVPGRFNTYTAGGVTVIIDYAHTPDGLQKILTAARELLSGAGKLISVFGCGGDRDRTKRGLMGRISVELADRTVITSDNPRTEEPDAIIAEIERGIITRDISAVVDNILDITPQKYVKITDRTEAVHYALSNAAAGDIVVLAGKGHEDYMDIEGKKIPYSDAAAVKKWAQAHTITTEGN